MQAEILLNVMSSVPLSYRWFSITWQDGHVGAQNLWLMFCLIIESNSQKTFFSFILCTNMAAMKTTHILCSSTFPQTALKKEIFFRLLCCHFFFSFYILNALQIDKFIFLSIILGPSQSSFSPCLTARAKKSLSRAQIIFMPTNINSIALLMSIGKFGNPIIR